MIFGFNTDVPGKDAVYHVQTEDRGAKNPVIDSIIYVGGKIVDRRRTRYVPAEVSPAQISDLVRQQHKELVDAIRGGTFVPSAAHLSAPEGTSVGYALHLENAADLVREDQLSFEISVRERPRDSPAREVFLDVRWLLGSNVSESRSLVLQENGTAIVSLPLPAEPTEAALLLCARGPHGREIAKFRVRRISS